ncbi:conserved protein of unknown function [Rhodovastum atsumiense]|uniref:Prolyl oligopeptidase family serine peptidase n=1 Tax=Rhodovastum atsumiense TaxID=504468 RepID=A0A5M6IQX2_9PROT|nr:hypothetical protein F1189_19760 [Rhodovastum atsumiense]CAH2600911.1 conserved protein of unknown function [Rhodovastum atsumiense]
MMPHSPPRAPPARSGRRRWLSGLRVFLAAGLGGFWATILIAGFLMVESLAARATSAVVAPPDIRRVVLQIGDRQRSYVLQAPPKATGARPLVVALHGWLGTGEGLEEMSGLSEAALRRGFTVAYPDGVWRAWGVSPTEAKGIADAAFLKTLVADVAARMPVDPKRIYLVGFSAGGFMAQSLACSGEMKVAGVAVVASNLFATAASACPHPPAVPFLVIHGTADPMVPYGGGETPRGTILSIPETLAYWAQANGCAGPFTRAPATSADPVVPVLRESAMNCPAGRAVEALLLEGGGHDWPGTAAWLPSFIVGQRSDAVNATGAILDFLLRGQDGSRSAALGQRLDQVAPGDDAAQLVALHHQHAADVVPGNQLGDVAQRR